MPWLWVILAASLEIVWASWIKHANSIGNWMCISVLIVVSFLMLIKSYKHLPVAIAYSVFVGIGTIGTCITSAVFWGESISIKQVLFLGILLVGIIGLKLTIKEGGH